jgi:hypothetical protein
LELPLNTLVAAVAAAGLGEPHAVLAGAERFVSARDDSAGKALRLDDDFCDMLKVVQRGNKEYYGWLTSLGGTEAVLAASLGPDALVLKRTGQSVHLEQVRPERVIGALLDQLPEVPAAREAPICVPPGEPVRNGFLIRNRPSAKDDRVRLAKLVRQPRVGGGMLYAASRDRTGTRRRSREWITIIDTGTGRWVIYVASDGAVIAVPGTRQVLAGKLAELCGEGCFGW